MPRFLRPAALVLAFAIPALVFAQLRTIPDEAKRGEIRHVMGMRVEINGLPQQLAPGAQIRDTFNRTILPASVPPGASIRFLLDTQGLVRQVWVLTAEEAAKR